MDGPERERDDGRSTIRLFVETALDAGAAIALAPGQAHYLRNVMRQAPGDRIRLFNGRDGEWAGTIETIAPHRAAIRLATRTAEQTPAPDLHLLFAPLKATRTRFVIEKATELGVGAIQPGAHPAWPDRARQRRAAPCACDRSGGAVRPPRRAADCTPLLPRRRARRLAARPPAARLRPRGRADGRRRAVGWRRRALGNPGGAGRRICALRAASARRSSGGCARPSRSAQSCAQRPPWRQHWPAGRPLRATGGEAVLRATQACHVG